VEKREEEAYVSRGGKKREEGVLRGGEGRLWEKPGRGRSRRLK